MYARPLKYEFTDIEHLHVPGLYRIRALRDIDRHSVRRGDLGGYIEDDCNLSHRGDCWVGGDAIVKEEASVQGNAYAGHEAFLTGQARLWGNAQALNETEMFDRACAYDNAVIMGRTRMINRSRAHGRARITNAVLSFGASIGENANVNGGATVAGDVAIGGHTYLSAGAYITRTDHVLRASVMGSDMFKATMYRTRDNGAQLFVGCWDGTLEEFRIMIESDTWVEASPREVELRRPEMLAFIGMCEARVATWDDEPATPTRTSADNTHK